MKRNLKTVTLERLIAQGACEEGIQYWERNGSPRKVSDCINNSLGSHDEIVVSYGNWLLSHSLSQKNRIRYVVYAAEKCLVIYEKFFPDYTPGRILIESLTSMSNRLDKYTERSVTQARSIVYADYRKQDSYDQRIALSSIYHAGYSFENAKESYLCVDDAYDLTEDLSQYKEMISYGLELLDA